MLVVIFFLVFGLGFATPTEGVLGGTGVEYSTDEAIRIFEAELGRPLPAGVTLTHFYEGGFQDGFIQVRLTATATGLDALAATLPVGPPERYVPDGFGVTGLPWWDADDQPQGMLYSGSFGHYPHASLFAAPDPNVPDRFRVYVTAFEM